MGLLYACPPVEQEHTKNGPHLVSFSFSNIKQHIFSTWIPKDLGRPLLSVISCGYAIARLGPVSLTTPIPTEHNF